MLCQHIYISSRDLRAKAIFIGLWAHQKGSSWPAYHFSIMYKKNIWDHTKFIRLLENHTVGIWSFSACQRWEYIFYFANPSHRTQPERTASLAVHLAGNIDLKSLITNRHWGWIWPLITINDQRSTISLQVLIVLLLSIIPILMPSSTGQLLRAASFNTSTQIIRTRHELTEYLKFTCLPQLKFFFYLIC